MMAPDSQMSWNIAEVFLRIFALRATKIELRIGPRQVLSGGMFPPGWNMSNFYGLPVEVVQVVRDCDVPAGVGLLHELGSQNVDVIKL